MKKTIRVPSLCRRENREDMRGRGAGVKESGLCWNGLYSKGAISHKVIRIDHGAENSRRRKQRNQEEGMREIYCPHASKKSKRQKAYGQSLAGPAGPTMRKRDNHEGGARSNGRSFADIFWVTH